MEERLIDDAALWKKNRELGIEAYNVPEPTDQPDFVNISSEAGELPGLDGDGADGQHDITNKDVSNELNALKLSEPTAKLIVSLMDVLLPNLAVLISKKKEDKQIVKLDSDEKEALTGAFANYLKETSFHMSPGAVLVTAIAGIYVPKFATVYMHRNEPEKQPEEKEDTNEATAA